MSINHNLMLKISTCFLIAHNCTVATFSTVSFRPTSLHTHTKHTYIKHCTCFEEGIVCARVCTCSVVGSPNSVVAIVFVW